MKPLHLTNLAPIVSGGWESPWGDLQKGKPCSTEQAHSGVQGAAPLKGTACEDRAAKKSWFDIVRKLINVS